jgi:hypothetical protein
MGEASESDPIELCKLPTTSQCAGRLSSRDEVDLQHVHDWLESSVGEM